MVTNSSLLLLIFPPCPYSLDAHTYHLFSILIPSIFMHIIPPFPLTFHHHSSCHLDLIFLKSVTHQSSCMTFPRRHCNSSCSLMVPSISSWVRIGCASSTTVWTSGMDETSIILSITLQLYREQFCNMIFELNFIFDDHRIDVSRKQTQGFVSTQNSFDANTSIEDGSAGQGGGHDKGCTVCLAPSELRSPIPTLQLVIIQHCWERKTFRLARWRKR